MLNEWGTRRFDGFPAEDRAHILFAAFLMSVVLFLPAPEFMNAGRAFLFLVGLFFVLLMFGQWVMKLWHHNAYENARLYALNVANGLVPPAYIPELQAEPEPTQPVEVLAVQRLPNNSFHAEQKVYKNPPTLPFLKVLFGSVEDDGRILSEREFARRGTENNLWRGAHSDLWLDILEEQGIIRKVFDAKKQNSWREIVPEVTFEMACERFGIATAPPPEMSD